MPDIFWYFVLFLFFVYLIYDSIDENNKKKQAEISRIEYEKKAELQKIEYEKEQLEKERKAIEHEKYLESDEYKQKLYTDEYVFNVKLSFEEYLNTHDPTPDRIGNDNFYIYKECMSKWYTQLLSKYRYNDVITFKIKSDFLDYIRFLRESGSLAFMAFDVEGVENQDEWIKSFHYQNNQKKLIEDSFAAVLGDEAIEQLKKSRNLNSLQYAEYAKNNSSRYI